MTKFVDRETRQSNKGFAKLRQATRNTRLHARYLTLMKNEI